MRGVRWWALSSTALLWAALFVACGAVDRTPAEISASVGRADLELMVVPKRELGSLAKGLALDGESGPTSNREVAEDSVDPSDTGRTLQRDGRIAGYDLVYGVPSAAAVSPAARLRLVDTSVELFRTPDAAARYLRKQIADYERFRGRRSNGVTLAESETFSVDGLGDEAAGARLTVTSGKAAAYVTVVGFRRDRLVGSAAFLRPSDFDLSDEAEKIARTLDDRIQDVARGEVRRPRRRGRTVHQRTDWPDPKRITLVAATVGLRGSPLRARYLRAGRWRAYLREYEVPKGRLGSTKALYLRLTGQVHADARAAAAEQRYLASPHGGTSIARRFLRRFFRKTSFKPGSIETRPLRWRGGDTAGLHFFFEVPRGRLEAVELSVAHGRFRAGVMVIGFDRYVTPADVLRLRPTLRARLRRG